MYKFFTKNYSSETQVVILAAGQGSRLYPLTLNCPKALLPFEEEPLLVRTVRQLDTSGFKSIRIVTGYLHHLIENALHNFNNIKFVYNERYASDANTLSLSLALQDVVGPALIIEADVVLSDVCWPVIKKVCSEKQSAWFTCGKFIAHQTGGIIKSDGSKKITDMKIVSKYDSCFNGYSKNLGVVYMGPDEISCYKNILAEMATKQIASHYMEHWIKHLPELSCNEVDLFPYPAGSFNTIEELEQCRLIIRAPYQPEYRQKDSY